MAVTKSSRRGFLGALLGAAAAAPGMAMGVDVASGPDKTAFNFTCSCGEGFAAGTPEKVGDILEIECACGLQWRLEWRGDCFKTRMLNPKPEERSVDEDVAAFLKAANEAREVCEKADAEALAKRA